MAILNINCCVWDFFLILVGTFILKLKKKINALGSFSKIQINKTNKNFPNDVIYMKDNYIYANRMMQQLKTAIRY